MLDNLVSVSVQWYNNYLTSVLTLSPLSPLAPHLQQYHNYNKHLAAAAADMSSLAPLLSQPAAEESERAVVCLTVYGNCGNEALADLTNSSLIQNSAHRQFDIISRSRTLAVTSHHQHPASCSSRLQSALILSDFYKYVISTNIFCGGGGGGWHPSPLSNVPLYLWRVSSCISPTPTHQIFLI